MKEEAGFAAENEAQTLVVLEMIRKTSTWLLPAIAVSLLGDVSLNKEPAQKFPVSFGTPSVEARSSGGRSRGGSFGSSSSSSIDIVVMEIDGLVAVIITSILIVVLIIVIWKFGNPMKRKIPPALSNNIVTVSKLQIALLSNARHVQEQLTTASQQTDLKTREELANFLQEAALTLLRSSEYWSHACSHSETFPNRAEASKFFEKLSVEERSNFSQETFRNEEGEIQAKEVELDPEEDPGAYIVVTLLVGTEDDKPLFDEIHSPEDLEAALKEMAATTSDYLLVFELLWSPQDPSDSLTYNELLTEYTDMLQFGGK